MIQALYILTLTMSMTFMYISHPLSMGLTLLIQAILIATITGLMSYNFWFSYILFMIMIGGMLVLFVYMTSVASNEKFLYSNKLTLMIATSLILIPIILLMDSYPPYQTSLTNDMASEIKTSMFQLSLSKYLNFPTYLIMVMMIVYLLIALIAVVKITNITYGPLRQTP